MISRLSLQILRLNYILHLFHLLHNVIYITLYLQTHQIKMSLIFFKFDNCSYSSKDFFLNPLNNIVVLVDILCKN